MQASKPPSFFWRFLNVASAIYLATLFLWFISFLLLGDGVIGYLGLANAVAVYLFVPLPVALISAGRNHDRRLLIASLLAAALFAWLWGPLYLPRFESEVEGPSLRVLTLNVLGKAGYSDTVMESILAADADVVFLQEFTPNLATLLSVNLSSEFPYQVLEPRYGSDGLAVFSRFPIERQSIVIEGEWKGGPQVLRLDWEGRAITLVNIHTKSTGAVWPGLVRFTTHARLEALIALADFVAQQEGPVIVAGDANTTRMNQPYQQLDAVLDDAWWEAGWGLGHTFPGHIEDGDWFTRISFFVIPHWLVRIDHVFYSDEFLATEAALAEFNGGSDHRGIVTELVWLH